MKIISLEQIKKVLPKLDLIPEIEAGFRAFSEGQASAPPVGELILDKGEVHIKYGYIHQDDFYVIKIASGFYENTAYGISSSNGLMLVFDQETGKPQCILLDEGYLTNVRTAVAGAIVAKYLAPSRVEQIGILGAGTQARLQLSYLKGIVNCNKVLVWGLNDKKLLKYKEDMEQEGFRVKTTLNSQEVLNQCKLIISTTPSKIPVLDHQHLQAGTHITAIGSDTPEKQELDPLILRKSDLLVTDSLEQCKKRGEIFQAKKAGLIHNEKVLELGSIISGLEQGRSNDNQISVADLTGLVVQDIKIASAVLRALEI